MKLKAIQLEDKLKLIETKIKNKNNFNREDVQNAIHIAIKNCDNLRELKDTIKAMITRTGVVKIGFKTFYTPRTELEEENKTFGFLSDIKSYMGIRQKYYRDNKWEE